MAQNRLNFLFMCSFAAVCLFAIALSRRPLCIDSTIVQKIDRWSVDSETLYGCASGRAADFAPELMRLRPALEARLRPFERTMARLGVDLPGLRLVIPADRPYAYRAEQGRLFIGEELLRARGHLERAALHAWLTEIDGGSSRWRRHALADALTMVIFGDLELRDPVFARDLRVHESQVALTSPESPCTSSWRASETYERCLREGEAPEGATAEVTLRAVFASAMARSYQSLGFAERIAIARRARVLGPATHARTPVAAEAGSLAALFAEARSFERELEVRLGRLGEPGRSWFRALGAELRRRGLPQDPRAIEIETLVVDERGNEHRAELVSGTRAGLALLTEGGLRFPPSSELFARPEDLRARNLVWIGCRELSFGRVLEFDFGARKLLAVKSCDEEKIDLRPWLRGDTPSFSKANPGVAFVVFDLPSLRSRERHLDRALDVWGKVEGGVGDETLRDTFGWRSVEILNDGGLSKPRAFIDAIEWFRVN